MAQAHYYKAKDIDTQGYIYDVANEADVNAMVSNIASELGDIDICCGKRWLEDADPQYSIKIRSIQH